MPRSVKAIKSISGSRYNIQEKWYPQYIQKYVVDILLTHAGELVLEVRTGQLGLSKGISQEMVADDTIFKCDDIYICN